MNNQRARKTSNRRGIEDENEDEEEGKVWFFGLQRGAKRMSFLVR